MREIGLCKRVILLTLARRKKWRRARRQGCNEAARLRAASLRLSTQQTAAPDEAQRSQRKAPR
jgi:hypothetical protein